MKVYCIYLDNIFLKSFRKRIDAETLFTGLQFFLITHDMEVDMVRIRKEDF